MFFFCFCLQLFSVFAFSWGLDEEWRVEGDEQLNKAICRGRGGGKVWVRVGWRKGDDQVEGLVGDLWVVDKVQQLYLFNSSSCTHDIFLPKIKLYKWYLSSSSCTNDISHATQAVQPISLLNLKLCKWNFACNATCTNDISPQAQTVQTISLKLQLYKWYFTSN